MAQVFKDERSIGDLFSELATETTTLVRQEFSLAQAELTQKAMTTGRNVAFLVVGGAVAYAAALALMLAVVLVLSMVMPAWAAVLLVSVVVGIGGFAMISSGLASLRKTELTPRETVKSIKEDAKWLKNQVN